MKKLTWTLGTLILAVVILGGCSDSATISSSETDVDLSGVDNSVVSKGVLTANGWYEGEEIYYLLLGEEGVTSRSGNDLYLIGGDRMYQANVAEFIPGEPGYTPHWNVNVVHTADGKTLDDILTSSYVSSHYPEALFDDVEDILGAESAGLITVETPGVVVLCPIVPEKAAEAPGNTELSEDFPDFPMTF